MWLVRPTRSVRELPHELVDGPFLHFWVAFPDELVAFPMSGTDATEGLLCLCVATRQILITVSPLKRSAGITSGLAALAWLSSCNHFLSIFSVMRSVPWELKDFQLCDINSCYVLMFCYLMIIHKGENAAFRSVIRNRPRFLESLHMACKHDYN